MHVLSINPGITVSESETLGESDSETHGTSRTRAEGENRQRSKTKTAGVVAGRGHARGRGTTRVASRARTAGTAASWAEGTAESSSWADGSGLNMGDSMSMGESMPILPDGGEGIVTTFTGSGSNMVQSSVSTAGGGVSHSRMRGGARVTARTEGQAAGDTNSLVESESSANHSSEGEGESAGWSSSESEGENESSSHTNSRSVTRGRSPSYSRSSGWSESEAVTPFMATQQRRVPSSIAYVTPEEQTLEHIKEMKNIPIAHAMLMLPMKPAATVRFPWVKKRHVPESLRQRGREQAYDRPYHSAFTEPKAVPLLPEAPEGDVIDVHLDTRRKRTMGSSQLPDDG